MCLWVTEGKNTTSNHRVANSVCWKLTLQGHQLPHVPQPAKKMRPQAVAHPSQGPAKCRAVSFLCFYFWHHEAGTVVLVFPYSFLTASLPIVIPQMNHQICSIPPFTPCFRHRGCFVGSVKLYSHQEALFQPLDIYHQEADISAAMKIKINQNAPKFDLRKLKIAPCLEIEAAF